MGVVVVPPQELDSWSKEDIESYNIWKDDRTTKNSKEDYIEFCDNINKEYDLDKMYDDVEVGLSALENFLNSLNFSLLSILTPTLKTLT